MPEKRRLTGIVLLVAAAAMLVLLVRLGFWQLDRAAEKAALKGHYESRIEMPPLVLGATALDPERDEFFRARAKGFYDPSSQLLIDNAVRDGRPGYRVVTPLAVSGTSMRVLVDRGWIPWPTDRSVIPEAPAPVGEVVVEGLLKRPAEEYYTLEKAAPARGQAVWQNLDLARYRELYDGPLQPLVLLLAPDVDGAGGFERRWPTYADGWIARHKGYAVTWFGLAGVLFVGVAVLLWRRRAPDETHHEG